MDPSPRVVSPFIWRALSRRERDRLTIAGARPGIGGGAFEPAADLLELIEGTGDGGRSGAWPPNAFRDEWETVRKWRAFLETDRGILATLARWEEPDRAYKADPLPQRIAEAWSDHLYGEDPVVKAPRADDPQAKVDDPNATDATPDDEEPEDQALYDRIVEGNGLPDELRAAERTCVGEGEVWWRVAVDRDVADHPLIEFHSREVVCPLFVGRKLKAVALVTTYTRKRQTYRHFELHTDGRVDHYLYQGTPKRLGQQVDLGSLDATADLEETWDHQLPMLMGRVVNRRGRRFDLGRSDYDGIDDFLLELNEAISIGGENMRLTAKKRAVVDESVIDLGPASITGADNGDGTFEALTEDGTTTGRPLRATMRKGTDLLVATKLDASLDDGYGPFKVLEYSYDAEALIAHKRDLVESALTRIGLTPAWVGIKTGDNDGTALSGTAYRLKLVPTDKAGRGKARPWDRTVPQVLLLAAQVSDLDEADGGFGEVWDNIEDPPVFERADPLPIDEVEQAQVQASLVTAGVRSVRQAVIEQHPGWTDKQVNAEVTLIKEERAATAASAAPSPIDGLDRA